jgi:hypothetical protein
MDTSENFEGNSNKFETKFSKIPKSFSIESLIAKRSNQSRGSENEDSVQSDEPSDVNFFPNGYPLLPFPNFPLYNPWVGYLSQTAAPNLFANGQQPLQTPSNDKLAQFLDTTALINNECKDKISELLFNPLSTLSSPSAAGGGVNGHPSSNFLQQHQQNQEQFLLNNKLKDNYFLTDFYNNFMLSENNKYLFSGRANGHGHSGPNGVNCKNKIKKNNCSKKTSDDQIDQRDINVDGDSCDETGDMSMPEEDSEDIQNQIEESHDGSCSDLSLNLSPNGINANKLDRGEFRTIQIL